MKYYLVVKFQTRLSYNGKNFGDYILYFRKYKKNMMVSDLIPTRLCLDSNAGPDMDVSPTCAGPVTGNEIRSLGAPL